MTININAGAWPRGNVSTRHQMPDGRIVQVDINWNLVYWLARKALANKGRKATAGPVTVRLAGLLKEAK